MNVLFAQHVLSADFFTEFTASVSNSYSEGDDQRVFQLFSQLVRLLEKSGSNSSNIAQSSMEEFTTFVEVVEDDTSSQG